MPLFTKLNLIIDIGNTNTKCALFANEKMLKKIQFKSFGTKQLQKIFDEFSQITHSILCSVVEHNSEINEFLKSRTSFIIFDSHTKLKIKNSYKTPETLGKDRLASAIGANFLYPNKNVLIVDVGTCIKFDFIDYNNNYLGGSISPGISMRYKALKHFTSKLPLIAYSENKAELIGDTTERAIQSGVQNGVEAEIVGIINQYKNLFDDLICLITGGAAVQLHLNTKITILAAPNLVLLGLNNILNYNKLL